jgi:hypothetical protein
MGKLWPLLFLFASLGCGGGAINKDDLVGHWLGEAGMTYAAMQRDAGGDNEQSRFLAAQEMEKKFVKLELKADGTAVFENERILDCTWTIEGETVVLKLPDAPAGGEGKVFSGTYRFEMIEEGVMKADDPNVDEYFLRFKKQ